MLSKIFFDVDILQIFSWWIAQSLFCHEDKIFISASFHNLWSIHVPFQKQSLWSTPVHSIGKIILWNPFHSNDKISWSASFHSNSVSIYSKVLFKALILLVSILYVTICAYAPLPWQLSVQKCWLTTRDQMLCLQHSFVSLQQFTRQLEV